MTTPDPEQMAALLTKAQRRDIAAGYVSGHYKHRDLQGMGLVTSEWEFLPRKWNRQPKISLDITPLGLAVRNIVKDQPND